MWCPRLLPQSLGVSESEAFVLALGCALLATAIANVVLDLVWPP